MGTLRQRLGMVALAVCWLGLWQPCQAIVFTLRPGHGAGSVESTLGSREVLNERLTVNGRQGDYTVSISELSIDDALALLKPLLADWQAAAGARSLLIETPEQGEWMTRYYIVSLGEPYKTVVFRLKIPRDAASGDGAGQWPAALPRPPADRIGPVMRLGNRDTTYATFIGGERSETVARDYHVLLKRDGWNAIGGLTASGGVYVDSRNRHLVIVSVMEGRQGVTRGAVLMTPYGPRRTP